MKNIYTSMFIVLSLVLNTSAQETEVMDNQYPGTVLNLDGSRKNVIIETNLNYPWITQKYIRYFADSLLEGSERVKLRDKPKYDAKDLLGFQVEGKKYEAQKYADLSALGPKSVGSYYFLEVAMDGPIKLYRFYDSPPTVMEGDPERIYEELRNAPRILIKKGDSKVVAVSSGGLEKMISDCPEVADKYKKGEYGNKVAEDENAKKKSGLGKLVNKAISMVATDGYVFEVVTDYNQIMSSH